MMNMLKRWIPSLGEDFKFLIKSMAWLFSANVLIFSAGFLQTFITAKFLGVQQYGLLSLIVVYVILINQVIDFRITETVVKYLSEYLMKKNKECAWGIIKFCYFLDFSTGIIAFIVVYLSSGWAAKHIVHAPQSADLIMLYGITLLFSTINSTSNGVMISLKKFKFNSIFLALDSIVRLGLVGIALFFNSGIFGLIVAYIIGSAANTVILTIYSYKIIRANLWFKGIKGEIALFSGRKKEIVLFLLNTNFNDLLTIFTREIDILILGYFRAFREVGFYKIAKSIIGLFGLIADPAYKVTYPALVQFWIKKDIPGFKSYLKKFAGFMFLLSFLLSIIFYFIAPGVINLALGKDYYPAVLAVRIMLFGGIVSVSFLWLRPALLSMGQAFLLTVLNAFCAATMIGLSLIFVPRFGYIGSSTLYNYPIILGHLIAFLAFIRFIEQAVNENKTKM